MEKPRILFLVNVAWFFVSHRLPLAIGAKEAGYDVHVACAEDPEAEKIRHEGLSFHPLPLTRSGTGPIAEIRAIFAIYKLYRKLRPQIVHHVTIKPVIYGGIIARLLNVPAVVHAIPGLGFIFTGKGLFLRFVQILMRQFYKIALGHPRSRVIFQNNSDKSIFINSGLVTESQTVFIAGSGVDLNVFAPQPEPEGKVTVLLASRLLWDKGVGEFVQAASNLKKQGVTARFVLVGQSDSHNPKVVPEEQLNKWQTEGSIEWWGHQKEMEKVFNRSHIVCLPSYYREGMPKVLLEAAACGKPIITTDTPGCRGAVVEGKSGFLIPIKDSRALAQALKRLINNPQLRQQFGRFGRQLAEQSFSVDKVVEKTLEIYQSLFDSIKK